MLEVCECGESWGRVCCEMDTEFVDAIGMASIVCNSLFFDMMSICESFYDGWWWV